jgi:uncharacterized protein YkwD
VAFIPKGLGDALAFDLPTLTPGSATMEVESRLPPDEIEAQVIHLVNERRGELGLAPLQLHPELAEIARRRSLDMAQRGYFDHRDPVTRELLAFKWMAQRGLERGGENLFLTGVQSSQAAESAVDWWMDSRAHHANVMHPSYRYTGVGVVIDSWRIYITQLFL